MLLSDKQQNDVAPNVNDELWVIMMLPIINCKKNMMLVGYVNKGGYARVGECQVVYEKFLFCLLILL